MPLELLGVGVASRHHRRGLGNAKIGLPQLDPVLPRQAVEPLDCRVQQLGIGREGDGLRLHGGIDRDPLEVLAAQRAGLVRHPQALGQEQLQLVAEPLAPVAQVRALMRERVLKEVFAGEVLEIRVVDPALAHTLIGQVVDVLEQQQPDHEAGRYPGPAVLAIERRNLPVDPVPVDLAGEPNQLVLHVDDLVQPGPEQIARSLRFGFFGRIATSDARTES